LASWPDGKLVKRLTDVIQRDPTSLAPWATSLLPRPVAGTAPTQGLVHGLRRTDFRVSTLHPNVYVRVMFDLVMRHVPTGATWVIDYKTTSFSPIEEVARFSVAVQPALYLTVGPPACSRTSSAPAIRSSGSRSIGLKRNQQWSTTSPK